MMKPVLASLILALMVVACSSPQAVTYQPVGSSGTPWVINVVHKHGVAEDFTLIINDSTIVNGSVNYFSKSMVQTEDVDGKTVRFTVSYLSGFLGFGSGYEALVYVDDTLAARFKF